MIVTVPQSEAPYQGFQLGSPWYVSTDYINHQTSLTAEQARTDPDGKIRFVLTELGPKGVRVNSIAPGYIWADSLKWYLGHLAEQRGVTRDEVYEETAATTDLRALPEPDEIADAALFLISDLARIVTGQCLDANAGEFHH
jgi:enoyl-[acyl-carrier-protein] reductase (NADH)